MTQVDVVIPCYKYAHYLEGCVASVLSQRDVEVRILIVDDASPDNTPEVATRLAASDPRIAYVRNERNLGLMGTLNRGVIDWAKSEYVVVLSADDLLVPGSLARATQLMDAHPEVGMTFGKAFMFSEQGPDLPVEDVREPASLIVSSKRFLREVCEGTNPVPNPSVVMRTSVHHRIGGYNPAFAHTSDLDLWMRAAAAAPVGIINAVQGLYRWHSGNMSSAYHGRPVGDRREFIDTCRAFVASHGKAFPEFAQWVAAMEQRLGYEALVDASKSFEQLGIEGWKDALVFAQEIRPDYRTMPAWWKMQAKRLLGRRLASAMRRAAEQVKPPKPFKPWHSHGNKIGWWPDGAEAAD